MKKVFILFFIINLIFLLNSCILINYEDLWSVEITNKMRNEIKSINDIEIWVKKNIKYINDNKKYDHEVFQTCQETLDRGTGDCDDISILILGISYKMFRAKGYFHVSFKNNHCFCSINGKNYYNSNNIKSEYCLYFDEIHLNMLR